MPMTATGVTGWACAGWTASKPEPDDECCSVADVTTCLPSQQTEQRHGMAVAGLASPSCEPDTDAGVAFPRTSAQAVGSHYA